MNINIILIEHIIFFFISWIIKVFVLFFPGMFIFNLGYPSRHLCFVHNLEWLFELF
ncbi:Uncharacterised protein [Escherichia coli]|uniref:Uncharacterized protein n=1 Tax=Escherichia coli TaxID=562 RepID=A0A376TFH0_ECOLX|nr:Uncharacterised protein [Escherichia coli]